MPRYFQRVFMAVPPLLLVALSGAWFWMRQGERPVRAARAAPIEPRIESLAAEMDGFAAAGDARSFFETARIALRRVLAVKWGLETTEVTADTVAARLGPDSEISRAFLLADEAAYSRLRMSTPDFQRWKRIVLRHVEGRAAS